VVVAFELLLHGMENDDIHKFLAYYKLQHVAFVYYKKIVEIEIRRYIKLNESWVYFG
jgi:hypothetical protein